MYLRPAIRVGYKRRRVGRGYPFTWISRCSIRATCLFQCIKNTRLHPVCARATRVESDVDQVYFTVTRITDAP